MKILFQSSLFRRYLLIAAALTVELFVLIFCFFWFVRPDADSVNDDLQLAAHGLLAVADYSDVQKVRIAAEKILAIHMKFSASKPQSADIQYAIFRGDQLIASSNKPPMDIFSTYRLKPPTSSVYERGWYVGSAIDAQTESVAFFAATENFIRNTLRDALVGSLTIVAANYLIFMLIASALAAKYATQPIVDLANSINRLKPQAFELLNPKNIYTELTPIVSAINDRTSTLKRQLDAEREFFSNAAHELRTPLAVIQAQTHALGQPIESQDLVTRITELQAGVKRAAHALTNMLHLARLDAAMPPVNIERLNIRDIVADCIAFHAVRAFAIKQTLTLNESEESFIKGNKDDLAIILDNLLDNAIKYAGHGADIIVSIHAVQSQLVSIQVRDNGPGFSETDFATMHVRFRRGSQAHQNSGSGLGLSISRAAAKNLGAELTFSNQASGGLSVSVIFAKA